MYLDNWQSIGPESPRPRDACKPTMARVGTATSRLKGAPRDRGLNENYARELMELHTLGVELRGQPGSHGGRIRSTGRAATGYTQADVTEVAKVFSGWTIERTEPAAPPVPL